MKLKQIYCNHVFYSKEELSRALNEGRIKKGETILIKELPDYLKASRGEQEKHNEEQVRKIRDGY
jgi:hypothetical protein